MLVVSPFVTHACCGWSRRRARDASHVGRAASFVTRVCCWVVPSSHPSFSARARDTDLAQHVAVVAERVAHEDVVVDEEELGLGDLPRRRPPSTCPRRTGGGTTTTTTTHHQTTRPPPEPGERARAPREGWLVRASGESQSAVPQEDGPRDERAAARGSGRSGRGRGRPTTTTTHPPRRRRRSGQSLSLVRRSRLKRLAVRTVRTPDVTRHRT